MKLSGIFTAKVEGIALNGAAVVRIIDNSVQQGRILFADGGAPNELLSIKINGEEDNTAELVKVLEVSPDRITPDCPCYCECGGCRLQHISYSAQKKEKLKLLSNIFEHTGITELPEITVFDSQAYQYRNRIQLHRVPANKTNGKNNNRNRSLKTSIKKKSAYGFTAAKSERIIGIQDCAVCCAILRNALQSGSINAPPEKDRWTVYGKDDVLLNEGGIKQGNIALYGKNMLIDAGVFFQSNGTLLEKMIEQILYIARDVDPSLPAADLYCGVGTFAMFMQDHFKQIDLLEENKDAVSLAKINVKIEGAKFFTQTDNQWVNSAKSRKNKKYGFVLADPSRKGLSQLMCKWLCENKPSLFVYVSCNPTALARDCKILLSNGYNVDSFSFFDFYPQTGNIESLMIFKAEK